MHARYLAWTLAVAVAAAAAGVGCNKEKEIDGIGEYRLSETTLDDGVKCSPMGQTYQWCSHNSGVAIGGQSATVDLYFRGTEPSTKAAEILVTVGRCMVEQVDAALASQLGPPKERYGTAVVWRNPSAVIVAKLPSADGACEISFLQHSETKRFAELTKENAAPPAPNKAAPIKEAPAPSKAAPSKAPDTPSKAPAPSAPPTGSN